MIFGEDMIKKAVKKYWPIVFLITVSFLITWPLFLPGYFSHHDDLQVMRIFEMRKCLEDGQIPCRWVAYMGFGNGYPLFNYYPPLTYYIGAILSFIFGFIGAAKILFFVGLIFGGISMYLLSRELFGKWPALVAASLYLFAPYKALDIYVRGALAESLSISIVPLIFYFILRLIKQKSMLNFYGLSISLAAFLLSHNIMVIFFVPLIIFWIIYQLYLEKHKIASPFVLFLSLFLGFGLAAFFIMPAYLEKDLVHIETLTASSLDFRAHFVSLNQLFFDRSWGYGASVWGPNDNLSFQVGWPHWWLVIAAGFVLFKGRYFKLIIFFLSIFTLALFMTHNRSAFIWERLEILKFSQFPWRFLSVAVFASSILGAAVVSSLKERFRNFFALIIILLAIGLNWAFFKPEIFYYSMKDSEKLSGELFLTQQKSAILDYLPKTAVEPKSLVFEKPQVISGQALVKNFQKRSNSFKFEASVFEGSKIEVPVFDFPNWQIFINGNFFYGEYRNDLGRISLNLEKGIYLIEGKFSDTPIRTLANLISLTSLLILFLFFHPRFKRGII